MTNLNLEMLDTLSKLDMNVPLYKKVIKLQEEVGELAQEFLAYDDKKLGVKTNASKSASGTLTSVIEEACDVVIGAIDILNWLEMQPEVKENLGENYIEKEFNRKLLKWHNKVNTKELQTFGAFKGLNTREKLEDFKCENNLDKMTADETEILLRNI